MAGLTQVSTAALNNAAESIRWRCSCNQALRAVRREAGGMVRCPRCRRRQRVPKPPHDRLPIIALASGAAMAILVIAGGLWLLAPFAQSPATGVVSDPQEPRQPTPDPEVLAWDAACRLDTTTGYAEYLGAWPKGQHTAQAKQHCEARSWADVRARDTIEAYKQFLAAHPNGPSSKEATDRIETLRRAEAFRAAEAMWSAARGRDSVQGYREYLRDHPNGAYVEPARRLLEDKTWQAAVKANRAEAYRGYLDAYPKGRFVADAHMRLEDLHWAAAQRQNTAKAYQDYLDAYPQGRYTTEATARLAMRREEQLWADAQRLCTAAAYAAYVREFPNGRHAFNARRAVAEALCLEFKSRAHGRGMVQAARYTKDAAVHPLLVIAADDGAPHDWLYAAPAEWKPLAVEEAQLVLIVGRQNKSVLSVHKFTGPDGRPAPSITRYRHTVNVRLVEARTGKQIASKQFRNDARMINDREPYYLTELGEPVCWPDVEPWLGAYVAPH